MKRVPLYSRTPDRTRAAHGRGLPGLNPQDELDDDPPDPPGWLSRTSQRAGAAAAEGFPAWGQQKEGMMADALFYRIVVPTDFSTCSEEAWRLARRIAAMSKGELILTHTLSEAPLYRESLMTAVREVYEGARKWVEATLEQWASEARAEGLSARSALRTGVAHREIVALATDERADLVVIGTHGRGGIDRMLLGSVADRVIRLAPCPVLTVRAPA